MPRAHLIYDGDCGFCTRTVGWLRRLELPEWIEPIAAQEARDLLAEFGLAPLAATKAALVLERGDSPSARRVLRGAAAINYCLRHNARSGLLRLLARLYSLPLMRQAEDAGYWLIARSRRWLPGSSEACRLPASRPRNRRG